MNIKRFGNLKFFYNSFITLFSYLPILVLIGFIAGIYWSLFIAPIDYLQGHSYRIMFVHVPAAWMSLQTYVVMAVSAFIVLVWKVKIMEIISVQCAPLGALFTFIALITGMIWGKPTWGTYWVWDARLTSELILFFLYIGIMVLYASIQDKRQAVKVTSILSIVGLINIPIIHFSVEWWNTLHQGPTVTKFDKPSAHITMLLPLFYMFAMYQVYFILTIVKRIKLGIIERDSQSNWIKELSK
ncbi:MAG: heme ABC transporter permease [Pseudomonadota bacterium]|nr:heme ABC transporter permease [Pseudomonadota bacterium]